MAKEVVFDIAQISTDLQVELLPVDPTLAEIVAMRERIDKMIRDTIMGAYAPPAPTVLDAAVPKRCCYGAVLHAPGCEYWNRVT